MKQKKITVFLSNEIILFPNSEVRFEIDSFDDKEVFSLIEDSETNELLVVNPYNTTVSFPDITELPRIATLAEVRMKIDVPNGKTRITLFGVRRVEVEEYFNDNTFYYATYKEIEKQEIDDDDTYKNLLIKSVERYINKIPYVSNSIMGQLHLINELGDLTDIVTSFLPFSIDKKKKYILELNPINRVKMMIEDMNEDIKFIELEEKIEDKVNKEIDKNQKEYYLREKLNVIQQELGDTNNKDNEIAKINKKYASLNCSKEVKSRIKREIKRYQSTTSSSPEAGVIRDYLDWMINLPWNKLTKDESDLKKVDASLNSTHFGLEKVKTRILEYLAVKQNTNNLRSPIICLVGPPGVGKTSLALSIAKALNRKSTKISVGGINDEAEIVGHRRTYVGALPGRIIQGMRKAGSSNPVFIIDEVDKLRKDIKGDPASSLLEVLDPEQNNKFSDHYIEEDFDLSKVMFVLTANYIEQIPNELQDRLEIIEVPSYTEIEKLYIARDYLLPRELYEHGLTEIQVQFTDEALMMIINNYTKEAGVRELQRVIQSILRKIVKKLLTDNTIASYSVTKDVVAEFLGNSKYEYEHIDNEDRIGVVNGMAYTPYGGDILPIEATSYNGDGKLVLTGSLGEVMRESAQIALSYVKTNAEKFDIVNTNFEKKDIHIHVPDGAIKKDGPSAGVALVTTLISLFSAKTVPSNIAMTGEITLRGKVLPIGGLREKVIGAKRAGVKKIFVPKKNETDIKELDNELKESLDFVFVDDYREIYRNIYEV
ncbi:MAG: endopeptidase La [Bacilli bacterium]|nr:endopeptidase La [Bacilli bacterium]